MLIDLTPARLRELALIGARAELERIYRQFPELRPTPSPPPVVPKLDRRRQKRRSLTPLERRRIARRMRAYWRQRRAA